MSKFITYLPRFMIVFMCMQTLAACTVLDNIYYPTEPAVFDMGNVQFNLPGPTGFKLVKPGSDAYQCFAQYFPASEKIFCLYQKSSVQQKEAKDRTPVPTLAAFSARTEFGDESISPRLFSTLCSDLRRVNGVFPGYLNEQAHQDIIAFEQARGYYIHSLGVYDETAHSMSVVRILKEQPGRNVSASNTDKGSKASSEFSGMFVSIFNAMYINGKYFSIYYDAPFNSLDDIENVMESNIKYIHMLVQHEGL